MFKYQDDSLVQDCSEEEIGKEEASLRIGKWVRSGMNYLRIKCGDGGRAINVSREQGQHLSHVWIDIVGKDSFYATEDVPNGEEVIVTESGPVPRKYFLSDESVERVVGYFLEAMSQDPRHQWVSSEILFNFWD